MGTGVAMGTGVEEKENQQCPLVVEVSNDSRTSHPRLGQPSLTRDARSSSAGEAGITFHLKYRWQPQRKEPGGKTAESLSKPKTATLPTTRDCGTIRTPLTPEQDHSQKHPFPIQSCHVLI